MSALRRVVFDTSSLIGTALKVGSVPHQALAHAFATAEVCASVDTLAELEQVLRRPNLDRYQLRDVRMEFATLIRRRVHLFSVSDADVAKVRPSCRDPKDDKFLALAMACEADVLVSSDADLLVMHPWKRVQILSPASFVELTQAR